MHLRIFCNTLKPGKKNGSSKITFKKIILRLKYRILHKCAFAPAYTQRAGNEGMKRVPLAPRQGQEAASISATLWLGSRLDAFGNTDGWQRKRKHEVAASSTLLFPGRPKKIGGGGGGPVSTEP